MEKKKGVIPDYEDDIFISYTHVDNDKYEKDHQGWVDFMHQRLETRLFQLLGEKPAIWRDPKLSGNDHITNTLFMRLQRIAILVAVLSPRYVNSEWCLKELAEFYRKVGERNPERIQDAPIFKVIKTPVDDDQYPEALRELLGYKFYEEDPNSGQPNEFSHDRMFDTFPKFVQRVNDLAWDIKLFVKSLQVTPSGRLVPVQGKTVYLAITAGDVDEQRDKIKRELQSHGHRVLPDRDFPGEPAKLREALSEDLRKSDLSIHLIGKDYDGAGQSRQSLVRLQHELAMERGRESRFAQVIWIPKGLEVRDHEQQQLIDALQHDANNHAGIEVLQDMLEDLKTNIQIKLKNLDRPSPAAAPSPRNLDPAVIEEPKTNEPVYVYLINDNEDYEATSQLRNFLFDQEIEVLQIATQEASEEKQAEAVFQLQKDYLKECDAAIIFNGRASDLWLRLKLADLRKSCVGRSTPLLGKGIYFSEPMTPAKQNFRSTEVTVIREQDNFPPESLVSFLDQVRARASMRNLKAEGVGR